jgi:VWFA-related protein
VAALLCALSSSGAFAQRKAEQSKSGDVPAFTAATRLVTVEVVVRDTKGPVTGLSSDDFRIFDRGKQQRIAVFSAASTAPHHAPLPLPPGAVSNRRDASDPQAAGATVLLFDQMNTSFENQGYARQNMLNFLKSAPPGEQLAVYMLGRGLHIIHDFTQDRERAAEALRKWNPVDLYLLIQSTENMDAVDRKNYDDHPEIRGPMTNEAILAMVQHLAGMPGRKNVIWISDTPVGPGSQALVAAGIHVYPVVARGVGSSGVVAWLRDSRETGFASAMTAMPPGTEIAKQRAIAQIAGASGGEGFMDSVDLGVAVRTATEDARSAYVLGFYPAEETLDHTFHTLTVNVTGSAARHKSLTLHYRPGYLATPENAPAFHAMSVESVLRDPLDPTAIGVTAVPGMADGKYSIAVTVDLHDVSFAAENGRHTATVDVSYADEGSRLLDTHTYRLTFTDVEFASALERGLMVNKNFDQKAPVRVIARDAHTGMAGSVRVALSEDKPKQTGASN